MGKKRGRERIVNPQPFLVTEESMAVSRNRSRRPKRHQEQEQMISNKLSDKILKEAFNQQKEIVDEQNDELNVDGRRFSSVQVSASRDDLEDIDDFAGFSETRSQFDDYEDQINEEDEKLLEAFLSKDVGPQPTLGDVIAARVKKQDINISSEARPTPKLDSSVIEHYKALPSN
ncbi:unnamed protein product [Amaranthus hypochondriacus]